MEIVTKRRPSEFLLGLVLLCHPLPVLLHILAVTVFALVAAWPRLDWGVIGLVIAAHAAMQISIAILNDYCDRRLDAESDRAKPIPRGWVKPQEALVAGLAMIVLMVLLLLPLNWLALLVSLGYLTLGQGYNLGLKSTPLSGVVFALAMPLIPLYAFAGVGHFLPVLLWLVPIGLLLGVALNLANSLPDLEKDAEGGARTLAVVLGVRRSFNISRSLILLAGLLVALLTFSNIVPAQRNVIVGVLGYTTIALAAMFIFFGPQRPLQTRKPYFLLVALTCIILGGGWLLGVFL